MNIDARAGVGSPLISMTALKPISMTALKQKHQARREPELNPGHSAKPPSKQKKHKRGEKEKKPRQMEESPLSKVHKPKQRTKPSFNRRWGRQVRRQKRVSPLGKAHKPKQRTKPSFSRG